MIAIVDYGVGNLFSLSSSLKALGLETEITRDADKLRAADRIILPGVGAFGDAKAKLDDTGLVPVLLEEAERSFSGSRVISVSRSSAFRLEDRENRLPTP